MLQRVVVPISQEVKVHLMGGGGSNGGPLHCEGLIKRVTVEGVPAMTTPSCLTL